MPKDTLLSSPDPVECFPDGQSRPTGKQVTENGQRKHGQPAGRAERNPRTKDNVRQRTPGARSAEELETGSDLSAVMSSAVSETIRRQTLRKWFHLPGFNRRDGLDDYDGDYRQFKSLGDVVTAHLRHRQQRLADAPEDACTPKAGLKTAAQPRRLPEDNRKMPPGRRSAQLSVREEEWGPGACTNEARQGAPICGKVPDTALFWNSAACAHGSASLTGCTRCRDACTNEAIFFDANDLRVRMEYCSGCGTCASVCPTGALYPAVDETLEMLKMVRTAAEDDANGIWAVFCGARTADEILQSLRQRLPQPILALRSRRPAGPGPEAWLAALAMGACGVIVLGAESMPSKKMQLRLARGILSGLELDANARLLGLDDDPSDGPMDRLQKQQPLAPADWEPSAVKRTLLWQAIDHLHDLAPGASFQVPLNASAPLGEVRLEPSRCTLCLACVGACPTGALQHGSDRPQVRFLERDCIQCGLCRRVCPEQAVTLIPRICYDRSHTTAVRVLCQADPLRCSVCGAPFATPGMVAAIAKKLSSHWMYQDPSAKERLTMCRDCRIQSLFAARPPGFSGGTSGRKK